MEYLVTEPTASVRFYNKKMDNEKLDPLAEYARTLEQLKDEVKEK